MKTACAVIIGILAFLLSACVTGDEITNYVIEPDGEIAFSIYRLNLISDTTGEDAKQDLAGYIQELEEQRGSLFTKLAGANAKDVQVSVLRRASPASVLITGRIPSLDDFAAYLSEENDDCSLVCAAISKERTRGFQCEWIRKASVGAAQPGKDQNETVESHDESSDETRFSLAEGSFTRAQGFTFAHNKRSAILDDDPLSQAWNDQSPSVTFSLEWQIPETP